MTLKTTLLTLIAIFYLGLTTDNKQEVNKVFNYETKTFNELKGGIDENYLNKLLEMRDFSVDEIEYYGKVDEHERYFQFLPLNRKKGQGLVSKIKTIITIEDNTETIIAVDKAPMEELMEEYISLKILLNKLNKIYEEEIPLERKIEKLCEIAYEKIQPTKNTDGVIPIAKLVQDGEGNCNDIAAAYFSLLHYYDIDAYICFGQVTDGKKEGLHAWLSIKLKNGYWFDLDPSWHNHFSPLENRNNKIKRI